MRILFIGFEKSWRGGENQILLLVKGLKHLGVECFVAYPHNSRAIDKFKKLCPVLELASGKSFSIRNLLRLRSYIKENKIQIIDANSSGAHGYGIGLKRLNKGLKLVVHRRVDNPLQRRRSTRAKYLSKRVDAFVAISSCISNILKDYGVAEEKIHIVRSAIDTSKYDTLDRSQARENFAIHPKVNKEQMFLGNAAAFTEQKGHEVFIEAVAKMKAKNFVVFLAGEGELKAQIEKRVKELNIEEKVFFLGHIENVPEFLKALDLMVLASNNEGLGSIFLDAIAAGCCVVGTRVGGIPEIILHNKTGVLVNKGDSAQLAKELDSLIENQGFREMLVRSAQKHIHTSFGLKEMVLGNLRVYKALLESQ